jgi:hypothetical protein
MHIFPGKARESFHYLHEEGLLFLVQFKMIKGMHCFAGHTTSLCDIYTLRCANLETYTSIQ